MPGGGDDVQHVITFPGILRSGMHRHKAADALLTPCIHHPTNKIPNLRKGNLTKMKLAILSIFTFITMVLAAVQPQKSVIVSYPNDTPDSIVDQAKDAIIAAGGVITHEYKLIK